MLLLACAIAPSEASQPQDARASMSSAGALRRRTTMIGPQRASQTALTPPPPKEGEGCRSEGGRSRRGGTVPPASNDRASAMGREPAAPMRSAHFSRDRSHDRLPPGEDLWGGWCGSRSECPRPAVLPSQERLSATDRLRYTSRG